MKKLLFLIAGAFGGLTVAKITYVNLKMENFDPSEFGAALPFLSFGLLKKLQEYRSMIGVPVVLSEPDSGGLIRFGEGEGQHLFGRAADIKWPVGISRLTAFEAAVMAGFTGIGVYSWGMHLDTRPGREAGKPATWGRIYGPEYPGGFVDVGAAEWLEKYA